MTEQLKLLVDLQDIDSSILSDSDKIESLPKKIEKFRAPFEEAESAFRKFKTKLDSLTSKKKDRDMKLDEIQDMIDKMRGRSSEIKTNKEYEAHLKEIEGFEAQKSEIEDEILVLMEEIDSFNQEINDEEKTVKEAEAEFDRHKKVLDEEIKKAESEIETKKTMRKEVADKLDRTIYDQYMSLLKRAGGLAVVAVKDEVCLGCNTNVPPQLYNDIKKGTDLHTCYYCKRFLYYREDNLTPEEETTETDPVS